jgi:uncharacterized protein (DUF2267 family)
MALSTTHIALLESSLQERYDWLNRLSLELGDEDPHLGLQALRGVLHALRDHLSVEQSAHLSAQFPTFVRGLYFERWTPDAPKPGRDRKTFLARIDAYLKGYEERCSAEDAARAVIAVIEESVSGGAEKIGITLPKPIRDLWYWLGPSDPRAPATERIAHAYGSGGVGLSQMEPSAYLTRRTAQYGVPAPSGNISRLTTNSCSIVALGEKFPTSFATATSDPRETKPKSISVAVACAWFLYETVRNASQAGK